MKQMKLKAFVTIGMLSAVSYVLMLLNFPLPPFPNFLLIDFSDIPALLGAIVFGPLAGVLIEFFKNVLNYLLTGSATGVPVGHVANFLAGITFILPVTFLYNRAKSKKGMSFALVMGAIIMAVIMSVLNYYVILPAYTYFLNAPAMSGIQTRQMIVTAIFPFNVVKGIVTGIVFMLLFARLQGWIHKQATMNNRKTKSA
jgi:riboflavin transporter FmnP